MTHLLPGVGRPFCQKEQRWAKQYGCELVGVVERDERHGKASFAKEKADAPADLKHLLDDIEFEPYMRRCVVHIYIDRPHIQIIWPQLPGFALMRAACWTGNTMCRRL